MDFAAERAPSNIHYVKWMLAITIIIPLLQGTQCANSCNNCGDDKNQFKENGGAKKYCITVNIFLFISKSVK